VDFSAAGAAVRALSGELSDPDDVMRPLSAKCVVLKPVVFPRGVVVTECGVDVVEAGREGNASKPSALPVDAPCLSALMTNSVSSASTYVISESFVTANGLALGAIVGSGVPAGVIAAFVVVGPLHQ
jgi:hypothetical protein